MTGEVQYKIHLNICLTKILHFANMKTQNHVERHTYVLKATYMYASNVSVYLAMPFLSAPIVSLNTSLERLEVIKSFTRWGALENRHDCTAFTRPRGTLNRVSAAILVFLDGTCRLKHCSK